MRIINFVVAGLCVVLLAGDAVAGRFFQRRIARQERRQAYYRPHPNSAFMLPYQPSYYPSYQAPAGRFYYSSSCGVGGCR